MATITDDALWALTLSGSGARPSVHEIRSWSLPDIAEALIIGEAVEEQARYHRRRREHERAAAQARR